MVSRIAEQVAPALDIPADTAWTLVAYQLNYAMGLYPIISRAHAEGNAAREAFLGAYLPLVYVHSRALASANDLLRDTPLMRSLPRRLAKTPRSANLSRTCTCPC